MLYRYLAIFCAFLVVSGAGCNNKIDNPFVPIEIPPPSIIADSLYTLTESGLKYFDLEVGDGSLAQLGNAVEYHYIMWRTDSTLVTSSYNNTGSQVVVLGKNNLIPGWSEGLEGMSVGGFRQLLIPPELAFGSTGASSIGVLPDETLIMELALLAVGIPVDETQ